MYSRIFRTYGIIKPYCFTDSNGKILPYAVKIVAYNGNAVTRSKTFTILDTIGEYCKSNILGHIPYFLQGSELILHNELREGIIQAAVGMGCYNLIFRDLFNFELISSFCCPSNPSGFKHPAYPIFLLTNDREKLEKMENQEDLIELVERMERLA